MKIPIGISSFAKIRDGGFYYVDKTAFIKEFLSPASKAMLITRPRRFGKTLTLSMLEDFFDISRDSKSHFEGLAISKETAICDEWMNKWPVVSLSFKDVWGRDFKTAYGALKFSISSSCIKYGFLEKSEKMDDVDKEEFRDLEFKEADEANLIDSLFLLTRMMRVHYGKPAILLIDEYDVPLASANENGYYDKMLQLLHSMLNSALKGNPYLEFGILMGCLRISNRSIFTGLNNLVFNTVTSYRFDKCFGFTEKELQDLLSATGFQRHEDEIRAYYYGYRFGSADVYCPWDVLNHVDALFENPAAKPKPYWANTSGNDVVDRLLEDYGCFVNDKVEELLSGGHICEYVREGLSYDAIGTSEESLWSLQLMTGYLTPSRDRGMPSSHETYALRIPNEEVMCLFRNAAIGWYQRSVLKADRAGIFNALWEGDAKTAEKEISKLLFMAISYDDKGDTFYHAFVKGLFAGVGYEAVTNWGYDKDKPDVAILDRKNRRALAFDVRHAKDEESLGQAAKEAVNQIRGKKHEETYIEEGFNAVISYGIAFKSKRCMFERAKEQGCDGLLPQRQ